MRAEQNSPSGEKRLMLWLIAITLLAALLVWLLCKLGFPLTPILAHTFIGPVL